MKREEPHENKNDGIIDNIFNSKSIYKAGM